MRIIIVTGSGGSGVSTLAAATSVALGLQGKRSLVYSLNPGLGDAFGAKMTGGADAVAENVRAVESRRRKGANSELRDWLEDLLDWRGMDQVIADDVAALPGINHIGNLLELETYVSSGDYDAVVVDAAPVEQFLELPPALDAAARWLERLFAPREQTIFEPFVRAFAGDYASAGEDVLDRGRALLGRLAELRELMTDAETCSVRIVATAGEQTDARMRESITAFSLFSYPTDAVVLSRLLPEGDIGEFFAETRASQQEALASIGGSVGRVPVLRKSQRRVPPVGSEALAEVAAEVYAEHSPDAVLHREVQRAIVRENGHFEMRLTLPHASKDDLSLEQLEDSVVIYVQGHRCVLSLPVDVQRWQAASWSFEAPTLKVTFQP